MRKIHKSIIWLSMTLVFMISACETTDLDLTQNPNALSPDEASTDLFINAVQSDFGILIASLEVEASEAVRILNMDGRNYQNAFEPTRFDNEWEEAYQKILNDIRAMMPLAEEAGQLHHIGIAQVLEAYVIITLVDLFGDIPYEEALQGNENLNPGLTDGEIVYATALTLLDNAIDNFNADAITEPSQDLFYGGNWDNWIKAANSLKLRIYVTTRLVDNTAAASFDAIIASGNYIDETSEDFQFQWGTSFNNPDARHPNYVTNYTPAGANTYMSNWLMDYMLNGKRDNGIATFESGDPRMKYYFYRQSAEVSTNSNEIDCVAETGPPEHYVDAGAVFCSLDEGYWGRDHGDDAGIPPDGQSRTVFGLYPAGGRFDDQSYEAIESISLGAGGAGITPIMLASWVDIMRAEMALDVNNDATTANTLLQAGVAKSFAKVRSFITLDEPSDAILIPSTDLDEAYLSELSEVFTNASDNGERMDILGSEFFVTLFGNGLDAFNFYRRTGRPSNLQPNLEPNTDDFFRSFFYPPVFVERNSEVSQKSGVTELVFWDSGIDLLAN